MLLIRKSHSQKGKGLYKNKGELAPVIQLAQHRGLPSMLTVITLIPNTLSMLFGTDDIRKMAPAVTLESVWQEKPWLRVFCLSGDSCSLFTFPSIHLSLQFILSTHPDKWELSAMTYSKLWGGFQWTNKRPNHHRAYISHRNQLSLNAKASQDSIVNLLHHEVFIPNIALQLFFSLSRLSDSLM